MSAHVRRARVFLALAALVPAVLAFLAAAPAKAASIQLFAPCSEAQAQSWDGLETVAGDVQAANCYAYLSQQASSTDAKTSLALKGKRAALQAVDRAPNNGAAQYLLAVLIGYEAQDEPWYDQMSNGLKLVPEIVAHSEAAAKLDPSLDQGGPDRALGEIYLQAPAPPMSVGDVDKAVSHFQAALKYGPDFPLNYVNLAKALIKKNNTTEACAALQDMFSLPGALTDQEKKDRAAGIKLHDSACAQP